MKKRNRFNKSKARKTKKLDYSKRLINDIRALLWVVTVGGIALAFYCIYKGYTGSLPWISAMVGLPWAAHGTVCSFYMNMSKSDHQSADGAGITYAAAEAHNFVETNEWESPSI